MQSSNLKAVLDIVRKRISLLIPLLLVIYNQKYVVPGVLNSNEICNIFYYFQVVLAIPPMEVRVGAR
jgi:hypothetical protein